MSLLCSASKALPIAYQLTSASTSQITLSQGRMSSLLTVQLDSQKWLRMDIPCHTSSKTQARKPHRVVSQKSKQKSFHAFRGGLCFPQAMLSKHSATQLCPALTGESVLHLYSACLSASLQGSTAYKEQDGCGASPLGFTVYP